MNRQYFYITQKHNITLIYQKWAPKGMQIKIDFYISNYCVPEIEQCIIMWLMMWEYIHVTLNSSLTVYLETKGILSIPRIRFKTDLITISNPNY